MHHSTGQSSLFPHRRQTRISSSCSGLRCRRVGSSFSEACVRSPVLAPRYLGQKGRPIRSPNETPPPSGRYSTNAIFSPQKTMMTEETKTKNEAARKSTRLNSSHLGISYAVFCLKKKN